MRENADGSHEIYIAPKSPAGQEGNWQEIMCSNPRLYGTMQRVREFLLEHLLRLLYTIRTGHLSPTQHHPLGSSINSNFPGGAIRVA
ncbi:hypothetical protein Q31a_32750 [Aureliella helgolandensis]|uniref:Uncharacterized protein n=1 Tax=Aureliella helgolandensis TaxID=2527968 RepID=A0A518G8N8_9BACT|nr:hypothetical protein Q31a_32750 [Aureliella helgolandensis]